MLKKTTEITDILQIDRYLYIYINKYAQQFVFFDEEGESFRCLYIYSIFTFI